MTDRRDPNPTTAEMLKLPLILGAGTATALITIGQWSAFPAAMAGVAVVLFSEIIRDTYQYVTDSDGGGADD